MTNKTQTYNYIETPLKYSHTHTHIEKYDKHNNILSAAALETELKHTQNTKTYIRKT